MNSKNKSVNKLLNAYDNFNTYAQKLEYSYHQLKARVKEIDREMAYTNERLNRKVEELDNLTQFLNSILSSMHSGVIAVDTNCRIVTCNRIAETTLNINARAVLGKDIRDALSHIGGFAFLLLEAMTESKSVDARERIIEISGGETRRIESSISILKNRSGTITGAVEIFYDLSEICELKGRLNNANNLISAGTMAACIAHEIRNPLNGIEGFARLLERELASNSLRLVRHIIEGTKNINKILTDLLLLARPAKLKLRRYELSKIIDDAILFACQELDQKKGRDIRIRKEYDFSADLIMCDPDKLQQAFLNIMINAIQSMPKGGEIKIFTRRIDIHTIPTIQIGFADTGNGINDSAMKNIYEPFFTTKDDGTGLGLAIVRKIIELHEGRINIMSEFKKGTTIVINLPASKYITLNAARERDLLYNVMG